MFIYVFACVRERPESGREEKHRLSKWGGRDREGVGEISEALNIFI